METKRIKVKCKEWGVCDVIEFLPMGWISAEDKDGLSHMIHKSDATVVDGHQRARILSNAIWGGSK